MDVIGVRHLGDVAGYLCGTGSADECQLRAALSDVVVGGQHGSEPTSDATSAVLPAGVAERSSPIH